MALVEARGLWFSYQPGRPVLRGASLRAAPGEAVAIVGPTGSGKTTLLLLLAGLLEPERGEVLLDGRPLREQLPGARRRIGILFQNPDDQLFNPTVYDEIAYSLRTLGLGEDEVHSRVEAAARRLRVEGLLGEAPHRLSAGQKRLVALASILAYDPEVLLLDEPTTGLDSAHRRRIIEVMRGHASRGGTVIYATHDYDAVLQAASRVCGFTSHGALECASIEEALEAGLLEKAGIPQPAALQALCSITGSPREAMKALLEAARGLRRC